MALPVRCEGRGEFRAITRGDSDADVVAACLGEGCMSKLRSTRELITTPQNTTRGRQRSATARPHLPHLPGENACACGGSCPRCRSDFAHEKNPTPRSSSGSNAVFSTIPLGSVRFTPTRHPALPADIPAWTEDGTTALGLPWLFASVRQRERILRHEAIHSLHQRLAPRGETPADRAHAETLAAKGEDPSMQVARNDVQWPVPALLSFGVQTYSPWTQVWVGHPGIVGEVVAGAVAVRIS